MRFKKQRTWGWAASLAAALLAPSFSFGQKGGPLPLTYYQLKNGLNIILSEDFSLPVVSVAIAYNVGSIHEPRGKTGMAAVMENLMFSGSANVPPRQHFNYINRVGGTFNALLMEDRTVFYQTVPSNRLSLVLWLESDRMRFLDFGSRAFEDARTAILEDLRDRKEGDRYFDSARAFDQLLYSDFANSHSLYGSEDDVRTLTLDDLRAFYAAFYGPNGAVLCITGNFDRLKTRELISQYFESLPRNREVAPAAEPPAPARKQVVKTFVASPAAAPGFHLGFRLTAPRAIDFYTLTILDYILFRGRSSRITRRLLNPDNKIAYQLTGGIEKRRDRSVYKIFVLANNEIMAERCLNAIFAELDRLKSSPLSDETLGRYKAMFKQDFLARLSTTVHRALYLTDFFQSVGDFQEFGLELDKYLSVTPADIVGIVARYFVPDNGLILNIRAK